MTYERVPENIALYVAPVFNKLYDLFSTMGENYNPDTCEGVVKKLGEEYVALWGNTKSSPENCKRFDNLVHFGSNIGDVYFKVDKLWENQTISDYLIATVSNNGLAHELFDIGNLNGIWCDAKRPIVDKLENMVGYSQKLIVPNSEGDHPTGC